MSAGLAHLWLGYGGTFDPVHAGHLAVARTVRDAFGADVHLVPAADPPHRAAPGASAMHRAAMIECALAGESGLVLDRRELQREGPSWTTVTLAQLRAERGPDQPLAWVLGADAFRGLPAWHDWTRLFELAHLVVLTRPGHGLDALPGPLADQVATRWAAGPASLSARPAGRVLRLAMAPHPASATELRRRLAAGEPPGPWLAPAVEDYLRRHRLYGAGPAAPGV